MLRKIIIILFILAFLAIGIWLFLDDKTKCKLLYGKNICNFYEMINTSYVLSNFDKMMNLCREMEDVPKKDNCFEYIAQVFSEINTDKALLACDEIKGFNGVNNKESCSSKLQTANWLTYKNEEYGFEFKYPSVYESPSIKEISEGKCKYQEINFSTKGQISVRPKIDSAFLCVQPKPYFMCGNYYFECSPSLDSFNCQPYKDASGAYNSMKIQSDLKSQGFNCSISGGMLYASYLYNPEKLQEQFQMIENAKEMPNDETSVQYQQLMQLISLDFTLFHPYFIGGYDDRFYVSLISNPQLGQGIRIIGYKGSDVDAANYYYRTVFLKDNKIISVRLGLFTGESLEWANREMFSQIGQEQNFNQKIVEFLKDPESPVYNAIQEYDLLSKSVRLNETADWQTYRNEEYGFEIKYPKDWKKEELSSGLLFLSLEDILSRENSDSHFHTYSAFISISSADINDTLIEAVTSNYHTNELTVSDDWLSEIKERIFTENTFLFVQEKVQAFGECHNFIKKGNILIDIERDDRLDCGDDQFNQMLSTFKFIE